MQWHTLKHYILFISDFKMRNKSFKVIILSAILVILLILCLRPHSNTIINVSNSVFNHQNDVIYPEDRTDIKGDSKDESNHISGNINISNDVGDMNRRVLYDYTCEPMDSNSTCQPLKFSKRLLPVTALYSLPGSGNTWMRHLIQQITGIYTGSVYNDTDLLQNGFPGEGIKDGKVVVVKTHRVQTLDKGDYKQAIILLRNPFEAYLAEFKRHFGGHTSGITKEMLNQTRMRYGFNNFMRNTLKNGVTRIDSWLNATLSALNIVSSDIPTLIIHYDNLKTNLKQELIRICSFLGLNIWVDDLQCTICNAEGNHHRKSERFFPYTKGQTMNITAHIKIVNETLRATCGESCTLPYVVGKV
ncbi:unnamed protein product [Owenia fusiformis]|uniref:Uncharacterized protein n=1 Tax=Owenia fusiformis TaxID=6347 RepID=A0A8J1UFN6_OWEFU|nr:unnamed protein product [Owenia fusiformis]